MEDHAALEKLFKSYCQDAAASRLYDQALWLFRRHGVGRKSNHHLKNALEAHPYVPVYLLGQEPLPKRPPSQIGFGDASEAIHYVFHSGILWLDTEGAIDWMLEAMDKILIHSYGIDPTKYHP
ncbi:MAG: hypothetical protein IT210_03735 [Armatimonadetes bacterium]|nr:hypothetical protein [Armatimonadota bacterium]